jgi:hypothetical protein
MHVTIQKNSQIETSKKNSRTTKITVDLKIYQIWYINQNYGSKDYQNGKCLKFELFSKMKFIWMFNGEISIY